MEFRVLQYFLVTTREQSISGAAESLHLSRPTLSRQLKNMEEELGKQLFIRSNRKITLREEGMILRKRAEEITELVKRRMTKSHFRMIRLPGIFPLAQERQTLRNTEPFFPIWLWYNLFWFVMA